MQLKDRAASSLGYGVIDSSNPRILSHKGTDMTLCKCIITKQGEGKSAPQDVPPNPPPDPTMEKVF